MTSAEGQSEHMDTLSSENNPREEWNTRHVNMILLHSITTNITVNSRDAHLVQASLIIYYTCGITHIHRSHCNPSYCRLVPFPQNMKHSQMEISDITRVSCRSVKCLMKASIRTPWKGQSIKQKTFSKNDFHEILDVWDKCVDYRGNYRTPKRTWWWKKMRLGKNIF